MTSNGTQAVNDGSNGESGRLMTAVELAEHLQISVRGVWRLVSIGELPKPIYIGRLARWQRKTVSDWIDSKSE